MPKAINNSKKAKPKPKQTRTNKASQKNVKSKLCLACCWYKNRKISQKFVIWFSLIVFLIVSTSYGIAKWYIYRSSQTPMKVGVTFIPSYASYYDLDPKQTMRALIDELNIKQFRLVSYWSDYETEPGKYDFSNLDWQFKYAEQADAKISLAIGLRQPRWPECHMPQWAENLPKDVWQVKLKDYIRVVIDRYKNSPALESYQLENEYFMKVFGICPDHSRERLIDEYNFVKQIDPSHPVIISRSNNAGGIPLGEPRPDEFGISIYKRVWDKTITKRYFEYPFPAWFYGFLAGAGKIVTGKDMIIHELQAEPWAPTETKLASLTEQDKSIDPKRLRQRFRYGEATGMREMYLWGAEWWYWRKVKHNDSGVWDVARDEINRIQKNNCQIPHKLNHFELNC